MLIPASTPASTFGASISPESRRRILTALNGFRPKFRQIARTLTDVDLVFVEEAMERWMLEYDRAFACESVLLSVASSIDLPHPFCPARSCAHPSPDGAMSTPYRQKQDELTTSDPHPLVHLEKDWRDPKSQPGIRKPYRRTGQHVPEWHSMRL